MIDLGKILGGSGSSLIGGSEGAAKGAEVGSKAGEAIGGAIGGGMLEASLGADAGNVLIKTTAILGAIFLLNTLVLARLTSTVNARSIMHAEPEPVAEQAPALPMAAPELPASAPALPTAAADKPATTPAAPAAPAIPATPAAK